MALIVDTGPLYAAMDRNEVDHERCARLLADTREPLVVPAPVVVEVDWLAGSRLGPRPFVEFLLDHLDGAIEIAGLLRDDYARIRDLLTAYEDLGLGFVDAAVLAVVERLGEPKLATLDRRHFATIRPRHIAALELLPA